MAIESEKKTHRPANQMLAEALAEAKKASINGVVQSAQISRGTRERLSSTGYLTEVIRGWYLLTTPAGAGTSTLWYSGYWEFIKQYLTHRFEDDGYCLSAESSLDVHSGQNIISTQLTAMTKKASNQTLDLPHKTSLLLYQDEKNFPKKMVKVGGLNLFPLPEALCRLPGAYFQSQALNAEIALKLVPSVSDLSRILLANQSVTAASRIAGAYEKLGDVKKANQIVQDMSAAGHIVSPLSPFNNHKLFLGSIEKLTSPYAGRIEAMWKQMRPIILEHFPKEPGKSQNPMQSLKIIERLYKQDAYHSLSIEGYQVTEDLIKKIEEGLWNPENQVDDTEQKNALAAKGYLNAFHAVMKSVAKVLNGEGAGKVFSEDLQTWYRELFTPLVQAYLIKTSDLAGYRNSQVYIASSRHVPPPSNAVLDSMETLFRLLKEETESSVKAILGHFIFVFIHPYMDGNGRVGRFIMNLMLVSGGYHWTVIRTSERNRYMSSLEDASANGKIEAFTKFVASEMRYWEKQGIQD